MGNKEINGSQGTYLTMATDMKEPQAHINPYCKDIVLYSVINYKYCLNMHNYQRLSTDNKYIWNVWYDI